MAKKNDLGAALYESLLSDDERLDPSEEEALSAEQNGKPVEAPVETPVESEVPAEVEKPVVEEKPEEEEVEEELAPVKPKSRAAERIQELVAERKAIEAEKAELAEKLRLQTENWARLEERSKIAKEQQDRQAQEEAARAKAAERAAQRPDPLLDPTGAELYDLRENVKAQAEELRQTREAIAADMGQSRQMAEVQQFSTALQNDLARFRAAKPDYDQAAQYATKARIDFWVGLGKQPEEARQMVEAEALAIAKSALDSGKSPCEQYWSLATMWGYKPAGTEEAKPAVVVSKSLSAEEKLKQIEKGQKLAGFGDSPNASEDSADYDIATLSPQQIAALPEDEFLGILKDPKKNAAMQKRLAQLELA